MNSVQQIESSVALPRHSLHVRVVSHRVEGLGLTYHDHLFNIEVKCNAVSYVVDRSYVDFVHLDMCLRKVFPKIALEYLPLDSYHSIAKYLKKASKKGASDQRLSVTLDDGDIRSSVSRRSMSISALGLNAMPSTASSLMCGNSNERISAKVGLLNLYIRKVLSQHEMAVSKSFIDFISEDSGSTLKFDSTLDKNEITEVDVILQNEIPVDTVVRTVEEASFLVKAGQLVVWSFKTAAYDIGFSVELNSETKLSLTRYRAFEKPICGSVEIGMTGVCVLRWDNSYSKLYNKQLQWTAKVVDADEYNIAKSEALVIHRMNRKMSNQRMVVFNAAVRHAAAVSGVIHASSISQLINEEEHRRMLELEELAERTSYEKQAAITDLDNALKGIDALIDQKDQTEKSLARTTEELMSIKADVHTLRRERDDAHIKNLELLQKIKELSAEVLELQVELTESTRTIDSINSELSKLQVASTSKETISYPEDDAACTINEECNRLLLQLRIYEADLNETKYMLVYASQQLVESKKETASLAAELVSCAEREDENRLYIEDLQNQLSTALNALGTLKSVHGMRALRPDDDSNKLKQGSRVSGHDNRMSWFSTKRNDTMSELDDDASMISSEGDKIHMKTARHPFGSSNYNC